ncbi:DNA primase [Anabaena phage Elbi]|nr:DNA primase [Anabaena phage Elbi]
MTTEKNIGAANTDENNLKSRTCNINNIPHILGFDNFLFLQHSVKLSPGVTKDGLRSAFKINRNDWKRKKGIDNLLSAIAQGYIHQAEVTVEGEQQYHFGVIDFDFWNKSTNAPIEHAINIEQIKQLPSVQKYCHFLQPSISYRDDAQNCHGYLIFDKSIHSKEQFQKCLKAVVECVKRDIATLLGLEYSDALELGVDGCTANNPAQVTFASLADIEMLEAIASVETLLKLSDLYQVKVSRSTVAKNVLPPESKPEVATVNGSLTVTDRVLKHLHDELFLTVFNGDARLLYSIHDENQRFKPRTDLEAGEIERWEGFNPFSGTNNSGDSFMVIYEDGKLPRFWDKSGSFERVLKDGYSSNHGTFLDYYFHIKGDEFSDIELKDGQYPTGFFRVLVDHICEYFGIDFFDWEAGKTEFKVVVKNCVAHLKKYAKHLGNDTWYVFYNSCWAIAYDFSQVYCSLGKPWIIKNYDDQVFIRKGKQILTIDSDDARYKPEIMRLLKDENTFRYEQLPGENYRYVPAINGLWDLREHRVVENDGQAHNFNVFPYQISPESAKRGEKSANLLLQYFTELFESDVYGKVIYNYFMLHCTRSAFNSGVMPCIIGSSGKGKTTVLMLLKKLINGIDAESWGEIERTPNTEGFAGQPSRDDLVTGYTHATENLQGKSCVILPEITNNTAHVGKDVMSFFKAFAGNNSDNTLKINPKGKKAREIKHRIGFFLDNEKMPDINSSIAGNFRRLFFVEMKDSSPGSKEFHGKYLDQIEPELENIFNYALTLDSRKLIEEVRELHNNKIVTDLVTIVRETNDSILELVRDTLEVTNNPDDMVSLDAIYTVFERENNNGKYASKATKKRQLINQIVERLKDKAYALGWTGEQTPTDVVSRCKVLNKAVRGFITGVRLTENALLTLGRHDLYVKYEALVKPDKPLEVIVEPVKPVEVTPGVVETPVINQAIADNTIEVTSNGATSEMTVKEFAETYSDLPQFNDILYKLNHGKNYKKGKISVKFIHSVDELPEM